MEQFRSRAEWGRSREGSGMGEERPAGFLRAGEVGGIRKFRGQSQPRFRGSG